MEPSSRPRHQIRAQGRRKGHAGFVIVENETSRLRWHPGGARISETDLSKSNPAKLDSSAFSKSDPAQAVAIAERKKSKRGSLELLEFLSRTAVQTEKEVLSTLDEPEDEPDSNSLTEFRRIISNVQRSDRSAFRQIKTASKHPDHAAAAVAPVDPDLFETSFETRSETSSLSDASTASLARVIETPEEMTAADHSGKALRSLLKELNDWLNASNITTPTANSADGRQTGAYDSVEAADARADARAYSEPRQATQFGQFTQTFHASYATQFLQTQSPGATAMQATSRTQNHFGFAQAKDWSYASQDVADDARSQKFVGNKLSPFLDAAKRMAVSVKNLPLGGRIESHENGAVLEKDELGRVTQIRARCGEIISIYYGRDGAPEGFVRTDAKGVLHSVAECDSQGVVLRDENGRVRAAGESLSIDPLGRISISRSDGQYWSIDLARQMLSEKRRLSDANGKWTALTAVFAADGFRMMTLFQKLSPSVGRQVRSQDEANRIWSSAAVETGHFRFYGRDGSTIEFDSEEGLSNLAPVYVSPPAVRPIEPRWQSKQQAGTAWQSVHEYVVSYLAV